MGSSGLVDSCAKTFPHIFKIKNNNSLSINEKRKLNLKIINEDREAQEHSMDVGRKLLLSQQDLFPNQFFMTLMLKVFFLFSQECNIPRKQINSRFPVQLKVVPRVQL